MAGFDDIRLEWQGRQHVIRANRVMGAIARIEDVITLVELQRYADRGTAPLAKIAMAYGAVLRYAGADASDDDVYAGMFSGNSSQDDVVASVSQLLAMMIPPDAMRAMDKDAPQGNVNPAAAPSSKRHGRQRSASGA